MIINEIGMSPVPLRDARGVGVEIGGTFTDLVWLDSTGCLHAAKSPSVPGALTEGVRNVLAAAAISLGRVARFVHGSTIATNTLLTRSGAAVGLLTTDGFRDIVPLGRADRNHDVYNMRYRHPVPPIERRLIREVSERIDRDGNILLPLDKAKAAAVVHDLVADGARAIAISLLHSYINPVHEKALARIVAEVAPDIPVFTSHDISPEFREYERSITTVINAFVAPGVTDYMDRLSDDLHDTGYAGPLRIMQSNGGVMPAEAAGNNAARMLLSGPAAGVRAAAWFAERNGFKDVITLDMGGTSTDIAVLPALRPQMVSEIRVDGLPIRGAAVDMATIGAGGGSLVHVDPGGFLSVGPQSAGARPGPVCYGRGGDIPTVTDAQVIAGLLQPESFFGGQMELLEEATHQAFAQLPADGSPGQIAEAVLRIVNTNMANAIRLVSTSRGIDPRDYVLVAFGGGGPLHGAMVARELGMQRVLVPWSPGIASAVGLMIADTVVDTVESMPHHLDRDTLGNSRIEALAETARRAAQEVDLDIADCETSVGVDMRYVGQAFELTVWVSLEPHDATELRRLFEAAHLSRFGYVRDDLTIEVVACRTRITARSGIRASTPAPGGRAEPRYRAIPILVGGQVCEGVTLHRNDLAPGACISGPAVIAEDTSTTFVPPGWDVQCLPSGDLLLTDRQ